LENPLGGDDVIMPFSVARKAIANFAVEM
jgi:hypothetical protein